MTKIHNMRKTLAITALMASMAATCLAQADDYATMKPKLNDKSLPLVNINVETDKVSKPDYTAATIEIADPLARTDGNTTVTFNCKVKYRGASSMNYDKKCFAIKLLDNNGKSLDANILGIRSDDTWLLDAMAVDRLRMRTRVNYDTWNAMSTTPYKTDYNRRNGTMGYFVELFINGEYHGLYCLSDKINRKLLGLKKTKEDSDNNVTIKGVIYKCASRGASSKFSGYDNESMNEAQWNSWELDYPDEYPSATAYTPMKNFIDFCSTTSDKEFAASVGDNLQMQNFIDYHVLLLSQGLSDNNMKNTFMSIVDITKGKRMMITPWDLDSSLGENDKGTYNDELASNELALSVKTYERLWNNNVGDYRNKVAERWQQLCNDGILSKEAFDKRIDDYVEALTVSGAWQREYDKWNNNPVALKKDLHEEAQYVKEWYSKNYDNLANTVFSTSTGISNIAYSDGQHNGKATLYNIMGQKVDNDYKGIVIVNGKKILKK